MNTKSLSLFLLMVFASEILYGADDSQNYKIADHETQMIAAWKVFVDRELLTGSDGEEIGRKALRLLDDKLFEITLRLPAKRIKQLQTIPIWIDYKHELTSMQYHPGKGWLRDHGYDVKMVKAVHIPRADRFVDHIANHAQPWALLHELAHAYHDQFLGWDHDGIRKAYRSLKATGEYESVLHINGRQREHYALTNEKEFFAEMSEAFLGTNDFYPFVRGELRTASPETFSLMQSIWMTD